MSEVEKNSIDKNRQNELLKTMYNRVLSNLPENELDFVKESSDLEMQTQAEFYQDLDQDQAFKQQQSLKSTITKLNDDNLNLKLQLDRLKESNRSDLDKLKNEFLQIREMHSSELKSRDTATSEMKSELANLRVRIKNEENEKEELRKRCMTEINSAKIRYENELSKQNSLMQNKYDVLIKEINTLNQVIKKLKNEKHELLLRIQKEKDLNKEILFKKEALYLQSNERYFIKSYLIQISFKNSF